MMAHSLSNNLACYIIPGVRDLFSPTWDWKGFTTAAQPRKGRREESEGMSDIFKRKFNWSLVGPWMDTQVLPGALSIIRKSETKARLG